MYKMEWNRNKTSQNLAAGMRMRINSWEWERVELKNTFPIISTTGLMT